MDRMTHKIADRQLLTRIENLCAYVSGKFILHAGCTETFPAVKEKLKKNIWLYQRLEEVCKLQIGLESTPGAIEYMYEYLGFAGIIYEDVFGSREISPVIRERKWDCLIINAGFDLQTDPAGCLQRLHRRYKQHVHEIIITTPGYETIEEKWLVKASFTPVSVSSLMQAYSSKNNHWFSKYRTGSTGNGAMLSHPDTFITARF